jgi:DNA-binding NarL/FixJ family response regulator
MAMPRENAARLLRLLRRTLRSSLAVIVLTGGADADRTQRVRQLGVQT